MLKAIEAFRKTKRQILKRDYDVRYDTIYNTRVLAQGGEKAFYDQVIDSSRNTRVVAMHEHSYYAWFLSENYARARVVWLSTGATFDVDRSFLRKGIKYRTVPTPLVYPNARALSLGPQDVFVAESWYFEPVLAAAAMLSFMELVSATKAPRSVLYCMAPITADPKSCLTAAWNMLYEATGARMWVVPLLFEDEFCMVRAFVDTPMARVSRREINALRKRCFDANHRGVRLIRSPSPNARMLSDMKTAYEQLTAHLRAKMEEIPRAEGASRLFVPEERIAVPSLVSSYMFFNRRTLTDQLRPSCHLPNLGDAVADITFLTEHARRGDKLAYFGCAHPDIPCVLASMFPEIAEVHAFMRGGVGGGGGGAQKRRCRDHDRVVFHFDETGTVSAAELSGGPDLIISTRHAGWFQGIRLAAALLPRAVSTDFSEPPADRGFFPDPEAWSHARNLVIAGSHGGLLQAHGDSFLHFDGVLAPKVFRLPDSDECRVVATRTKRNTFSLKWHARSAHREASAAFNNARFVDRHYAYEAPVPELPPIPGHDRSVDFGAYHAAARAYIASRDKGGEAAAKAARLMRNIDKRLAPDLLRCVFRRWCAAPRNRYSAVWLEAWRNRVQDYVAFMEGILDARGRAVLGAEELADARRELAVMKRASKCAK